MFLEAGTRSHFMGFLEREFPSWLPRYERLYAKKYAPKDYRNEVRGMVRVLQQRYGLRPRASGTDHDMPVGPEPAAAEQVAFRW